ncbi:MAG TPA: substrate-binding domain-containing protein [Coriobacteriia bacterium]|nr:substrate-binding domain-containing protein [Coriobacteriia bacterium]
MRRPALLLVLLLLALALTGLHGCSAVEGLAPPLGGSSRIVVIGSRTCIPLKDILEEGYGDAAEFAYLPSVYSGGGIEGVVDGDADIGFVARTLTDEEQELGLRYELLSWDALVFAVHPSVTIDGLTTEQIRGIYSGEITNWQDVGGPDIPMTVFDRAEGGTTKVIVRRFVLGEELEISLRVTEVAQETDMVDQIRGTRGAIGFVSLGWVTARDVPVRTLALDGIVPGVVKTLKGAYPLARPLGVVASPDAPPCVEQFLEWATGDEAAALIATRGYAPAR